MSATRTQIRAVEAFSCLGDACPDTCCKGWGMQLTQQTVAKYEADAPALLDAVTSGEAEFIMKRDPVTDFCVKFEDGWCGIHRQYGEDFLGDACHFYPRITRALNDTVTTSIAMSCPEAARLMLYGDAPFAFTPREEIRVPFSLKNYLPDTVAPDAALAMHQQFLEEAGNVAHSAERNTMRLLMVARALDSQPPTAWPDAARFYFTMADSRLPAPEANANDLLHIAQALTGLILASSATNRLGLMDIARGMQAALGMRIDETTRGLTIAPDAMQRGVQIMHAWKTHGSDAMQPVLRRALQAQVAQALFPLGGLGTTASERMVIIAVRLATLKLALMVETATTGAAPTTEAAVRIAYTLARFLDHLADPALSLAIYSETGWLRDARLRALLGDS